MPKKTVLYATSSDFKKQEVNEILRSISLRTPEGVSVLAGDIFAFEFFDVQTDEPLERDLVTMVHHKVKSAYRQLMRPCIVEHAGLILEAYEAKSYPGGLTQPMWDALGAESFIESIRWAGDRALARAVIGYCDGLRIRTFVGETRGSIAAAPRGSRQFYWDPVFCPEGGDNLTYAEITERTLGLQRKVSLSQSTKCMRAFLEHLLLGESKMFPDIR